VGEIAAGRPSRLVGCEPDILGGRPGDAVVGLLGAGRVLPSLIAADAIAALPVVVKDASIGAAGAKGAPNSRGGGVCVA